MPYGSSNGVSQHYLLSSIQDEYLNTICYTGRRPQYYLLSYIRDAYLNIRWFRQKGIHSSRLAESLNFLVR